LQEINHRSGREFGLLFLDEMATVLHAHSSQIRRLLPNDFLRRRRPFRSAVTNFTP
jgi:hypothetical protein